MDASAAACGIVVASSNVWLRSLDIEETAGKSHSSILRTTASER